MTLFAKSDGTTLAAHTDHVVVAADLLAPAFFPNILDSEKTIVRYGAVLHDLGKAHPYFQGKLTPYFNRAQSHFEVPHRHEISSLLFLPLFETATWEVLIDMVVAHHKSLQVVAVSVASGQRGRGFLDLINRYGEEEVFERHAEQWEQWHPLVFPILTKYDIPTRLLDRAEIRSAFNSVVAHCERKRFGRNDWRGLLMAADHLASALQEETAQRVKHLFRLPNLAPFTRRAESADPELYPLAKRLAHSPKAHTLVLAPTSSGKTDILLRRCQGGRIFYLLPYQASINAMYLRMEQIINGEGANRLPWEERTDIRRVHAAAQIEIEEDVQEETLLQRHPGAALKVMTPHQIAALIFGLAGHEAIALDVAGQHIVLDEIHVYGEQTQAMILALVRALVRLNCRIHIGSATIPTALADELRASLGGAAEIEEIQLTDEELQTYDRHCVCRLADEEAAYEQLAAEVEAGKRILFISNRVALAQERFRVIQRNFPTVPTLLAHSRFRRQDRASIERQIELFEQSAGPCIVCTTQVVEVSLDISFDTLITDCAPLDSLIQRFGRVNRRRKQASERGIAPVYVIAPSDNPAQARPYSYEVLQRSWQMLPEEGILREQTIQSRIDAIYPTLDMSAIDVHLIERDGEWTLPQLCNHARSLLFEALEIDTAVVIRASDEAAYREGNSEVRQQLEIPVSPIVLQPKFKMWPQLTLGHYPFICPDSCYDLQLGLMMEGEYEPKCIML